MPRRRKYRQRYDYSVDVVVGERTVYRNGRHTAVPDFARMTCYTPSQAVALYDKNPELHRIHMKPRFGGIERSINPTVDRRNMLNLNFHELVQRIYCQAPWTEADPESAGEHAIENALLLNIPSRLLLSIVRPSWLLRQKRELSHELNATHRRWLTEKHAAKENRIELSLVSCKLTTTESENVMLRQTVSQLQMELGAKDHRIAEMEALLYPPTGN